jgi:hypothetical protein
VGGWVDETAVLRIAYSNNKLKMQIFLFEEFENDLPFFEASVLARAPSENSEGWVTFSLNT